MLLYSISSHSDGNVILLTLYIYLTAVLLVIISSYFSDFMYKTCDELIKYGVLLWINLPSLITTTNYNMKMLLRQ